MNKINNSLNIINNVNFRLVYSFFISDEIESLNDHVSYIIHLLCIQYFFIYYNTLFDEIIFVIHTSNLKNPLIKKVQHNIAKLSLETKKVSFFIEKTDEANREGAIFKKYIIDKLDKYDGITLFFHNKGLNNVSNNINELYTYWIIGQYYFLFLISKETLGGFIRSNKLIFGWPYMCDNYHEQWLIGGSCYWMKCQEINKYIIDHNLKSNYIMHKTIAEYYFPEILDKELIDYPCSNIIKNYSYQEYYEPYDNNSFNNYLQNVLPYKKYVEFLEFHKGIINNYYEYINNAG